MCQIAIHRPSRKPAENVRSLRFINERPIHNDSEEEPMAVPSTSPLRPTLKASHRTRNIAVAVVLIIVLGLAIGVSLGPKSNSPVSYTFVSAGTVYTIGPGQYDYVAGGLPPPQVGQTITYTLTGSFTATNGITVYFMNYTSFTSSALGSSFVYSSGNVTSGAIGVNHLPVANAYYLVFDNTNPTTNSTVTITQAVVASGTPEG